MKDSAPLGIGTDMDSIDVIADRVLFCLQYKRIKWKFGPEKRQPTKSEVKKIVSEMIKDLKVGESVTSGGICIQRSVESHTDVYVYVGDLGSV